MELGARGCIAFTITGFVDSGVIADLLELISRSVHVACRTAAGSRAIQERTTCTLAREARKSARTARCPSEDVWKARQLLASAGCGQVPVKAHVLEESHEDDQPAEE